MDVRCERCKAQYTFDDGTVGPDGLTVQCTQCGHVFLVKRKELVVTVPVNPGTLTSAPIPASAAGRRTSQVPAAPDPASEYRVRLATGQVFACRDLTTLQKWVVERRVGRDDEVAPPGQSYRKLAELAELDTFFALVDAADRAPAPSPQASRAAPPRRTVAEIPVETAGNVPAASPRLERDLDLEVADQAAARSHGVRNALLVVASLVVIAAGVWVLAGEALKGLLGLTPPPSAEPVATAPASPEPAPPAPGPTPSPPATAPAEPAPAPAEPSPAAEAPAAEPPAAAAPVPGGEEPPKAAAAPEPATPRTPRALVAQAERLRNRGQVERALALYGQATDLDPGHADALAGAGLCYLDLERYEPAVESFLAALRADPEHESALLGVAEAYRSLGRVTDAIQHYEKYLAAHPDGEEAPVARNALEQLRR